jgi:uncharacterized protein (TIGR02680 family)
MTLFETDATIENLNARRSSVLPTPTKERYTPLRAGVLNVWEYDDQQFWFADGRLLLRGRNEAGKSKALELLFPFVLDGDMSPKKLDPFDTVSKTMWWNMVGFDKDNRKNPIGYLWLEFGRLDDTGGAEYETAIVGMQASTAERKVTAWFAVTPQRVDLDLDLQPGNLPLNQDGFMKALTAEARFATKASAHRANVAARLFLMSPERYDNLLHLLRQLRKPKLADKLDRKKLSGILTDALPPLDESRIEPLAAGFGFLDDDITALGDKQEALVAAGAFLDVYRAYSRTEVRQRADAVRAAITRFDDVTREETQNRRALEAALERQADLTEETAQIALDLAAASGSLDGLDLSEVETLNSLQQAATNKEDTVGAVARSAGRARGVAEDARSDAHTKAEEADVDKNTLTTALTAARRAAGGADLVTSWEQPDDHSRSAAQLTNAVEERRALVNAVREANDRATEARHKLDLAQQRVDASTQQLDEATEQLTAATADADTARTAFADDLDRWAAAAPGAPPQLDADNLTDELIVLLPRGDKTVRPVAVRLSADIVNLAEAGVQAADRAAVNADRDLTFAERALADHDARPADPPPARRPGIPEYRTGTPFWFAVEFTDTVTPTEAAMLEAALAAAGLLDAVLSTSGLRDASTDDTVLVTAPDGHGLHDWLRPGENAEAELVHAVLSTIGAGADSNLSCWVDLDGSWANGPLAGRWTKEVAEHIGAGARAAARARRRAELVTTLLTAETSVREAEATLVSATAAKDRAVAWRDDFPSVTAWGEAEAALVRATTVADKADAALRRSQADLAVVVDQVADTLAAVDLAITAAGCGPDQVSSVLEVLTAVSIAATDLRTAARDHVRAAAQAAEAALKADRLEADLGTVDKELAEAQLEATEARTKFEMARSISGASVEEILVKKGRLEAEVRVLRDRKAQVDEDRNAAAGTVARAEQILAQTELDRAAASEARDAALAALAAVVRSGHVALAVVVDADRDPEDFLQPTAGRNLARQVAVAVRDEEATAAARGQALDRLVRDFGVFRDAVPDFNPHLESSGEVWVTSATLNGELVGLVELHRALTEDVEERQKAIAAEERALIERHLRDEVGNHLGDRLHAATTQIHQMNRILVAHPTNSGAVVQLQWQVDEDAGPAVKDAIRALLMSPQTRDETSSAVLATFLTERVGLARRGEIEGADLAERLAAALDYRRWYTFRLTYKTGSGGEGDLTAKSVGTGSGGQQAKISHLPLLAAAAGFYASSPSAPRLCLLDEAFAGIDGPNTNDLLRMSVTLDLDMVMTNFDAWFCVPDIPGLAIYHLEKMPGTVGVAAIRYEWDGDQQQELDPWLDE